MSNIPFISIKSVLYELSRLIPEQYWNETDFQEWATKGLRRIRIHNKYEPKVCYLAVEQHKVVLPTDLKHLNQVWYKWNATTEDITELQRIMNLDSVEWNPAINHMEDPTGLPTRALEAISGESINWRVMHSSTNSFLPAINCTPAFFPDMPTPSTIYPYDYNCPYEYSVSFDGILTTTLSEGVIAVAYLRYPVEDSGDVLIPDNETLKEALVNYCLWMYFMKRDIIGEPNADKKAIQYKQMFGHMATKASAELEEPTLGILENIKNMTQRLVPRANQFNSMFSKLSNQESLRY